MCRRGDGAGSKEANRGVRGVECTGIIHGLANCLRGREGDGVGGVARKPAGFVELGDDGGGPGGTSKGVEVVGGGVGEEVVEDGSRADGLAGQEFPLVEGCVNCVAPCVV